MKRDWQGLRLRARELVEKGIGLAMIAQRLQVDRHTLQGWLAGEPIPPTYLGSVGANIYRIEAVEPDFESDELVTVEVAARSEEAAMETVAKYGFQGPFALQGVRVGTPVASPAEVVK